MLCVLPFASCANVPAKIVVSSRQPVLRSTKTVTARRSGRAASRAPTRTRAKTGEGDSVRGKPVSSAPSSPRLERRGAPGSKREPTTEKVRPARTSSPRFLLVLKSRAAALFDRGCSKIGTSRSFAGRSHALFETCCGGGLWLLVRASGGTRWTEAILKCFSGPFCPRSHRCCASTLAIRNARQPSSAFCCALGGWWLGRCGVAGAPVAHLEGGQGPNVGRGAVYTGIFVGTLATYAPIPAVFFSFSLLLSTSGRALVMLGPGAAHGFPPSSGACHRGAHQQRKTGRDPKSHVGGPGRYCSRGDERRFFPHPSYAGGLGELRGARGWLTWRCWPENATLAHTRGALQAVVEAAVMGRNGRGSGRYAGLGERKSHFLQ